MTHVGKHSLQPADVKRMATFLQSFLKVVSRKNSLFFNSFAKLFSWKELAVFTAMQSVQDHPNIDRG